MKADSSWRRCEQHIRTRMRSPRGAGCAWGNITSSGIGSWALIPSAVPYFFSFKILKPQRATAIMPAMSTGGGTYLTQGTPPRSAHPPLREHVPESTKMFVHLRLSELLTALIHRFQCHRYKCLDQDPCRVWRKGIWQHCVASGGWHIPTIRERLVDRFGRSSYTESEFLCSRVVRSYLYLLDDRRSHRL